MQYFIFSIITLIGALIGLLIKRKNSNQEIANKVTQLIQEAKIKAKEELNNASQVVSNINTQLENIDKKIKSILEKQQKFEQNQQAFLVLESEKCKTLEKNISNLNSEIENIYKEIHQDRSKFIPALSIIASKDFASIKNEIISDLKSDLSIINENRIRKMEIDLEDQKEKIAKNYLISVIQRYSAPTSVEKKSLHISGIKEEAKLKLMQNNLAILNYLEQEMGVDIIFEFEKESITVSHFDLVKKHIVRETIVKLLREREFKISLEKVEKKLKEIKDETKKTLISLGKKILNQIKISRNFEEDFLIILGRLKFRTSYGQNILKHSFEVGYFSLMLGGEIGLNMDVCKIGGFFHDIGKAIDQEEGRPHDILTKEIMEKNKFSYEEIHAAWTHHDAIPQETAEAMLVKAGDAISAGRPGARQETYEKYKARIEAMIDIASRYTGVKKTYTISGGREIRIIVDPKKYKDEDLFKLSTEVAGEIEENVAYPGFVKINVIRRFQCKELAKKIKANQKLIC